MPIAQKSKSKPFVYNDMQEVGLEGFRQHMVSGLKHGVVEFTRIPGEVKRHRVYAVDGKSWHLGKPKFEPNPHYPNGIHYSFPAWFVLLIGIPAFIMLMKALGIVLPGFSLDLGKDAWYPGKAIVEGLGDVQRDILFPEGMTELQPEKEEEVCRFYYDKGYSLNQIPHPAQRAICKPLYKKWNKEREQ